MGKKTLILGFFAAFTATAAMGGTFTTISVDGDFADWVDVPVLVSDDEETTAGVDFAEIKVANDDDFVYVYMRLYRDANPFAYFPDETSYFIDGDNNTATGFGAFGGIVGSEMMIQGPDAFQQAGGGWNEGTLAAGTVLQSPFGVDASEFEFSIDRNALGVAAPFTGISLITGNAIAFAIQGSDQSGDSGIHDELVFSYTMANPPACIDVLPTTYKTILIDGTFGDWSNVPAIVADGQDAGVGVDYKTVRVANDADYIYVYFSLYSAGNPFGGFPDESNYFIDGDGNTATGLDVFGGQAGSEILIQGSSAYQQAGGGWAEGSLAEGTVLQAPFGVDATEFEMAIDRNVIGVAGSYTGVSLITGSTIAIAFQGTDINDSFVKDEFVLHYDVIDSACPGAIAPAGLDAQGRPLGDLNGDCSVDLADYAIFQMNFTGP